MFIPLVVAAVLLSLSNSGAYSTSSTTGGQVNAQSQSAELAEASELEQKVVKLYVERKYKEALPLAIRVLELGERAANAEVQSVRSAYMDLAKRNLAHCKYGEAE